MKKKSNMLFPLLPLLLISHLCNASIRFGSHQSALTLSDNAIFDVTNSFTNKEGRIRQKENASIKGNPIYFTFGTWQNDGAPVSITGNFKPDPTDTGTIFLHGTKERPEVFRANPGSLTEFLQIDGSQNRLEGFPSFAKPIELVDADTTVTIAIKSALSQNIKLNGGTIILEENLVLADGVSLTGPGTIKLNDRRLEFGSQDLEIDTPLYWVGAADIYLNGKIDLTAAWTFDGECYFNGDSTILTLTAGGSLTIRENSSLNVREVKISGLGGRPEHGKIYFEDPGLTGFPLDVQSTSELRLRRAALELTTTYTINRGTVIAEIGSNQVITRDNYLLFEKPAKLIVDGINLFYKTRTFPDDGNIRPTRFNSDESPIELIRNGDILHYGSFGSRSALFSTHNNGQLGENIFLGEGRSLTIVEGQPEICGNGWYIHFARQKRRLLKVDPGVQAKLSDIVLKDFETTHVEMNTGASLTFGDDVTLELASDSILRYFVPPATAPAVMKFETPVYGEGKINGNRYSLTFVEGSKFVLNEVTTLEIKNVTLKDVRADSIEMATASKLDLSNVSIYLKEDFTIDKGSFFIRGDVKVFSSDGNPVKLIVAQENPPGGFLFSLFQPIIIFEGGSLHLDHNVTLSYDIQRTEDPDIFLGGGTLTSRNGIANLGILSLNGATLFSTATGLHLMNGKLKIANKCFLKSEATNIHEAIKFGDSASGADNNVSIDIAAGGSLEVLSGIVDYDNVT